VTRNGGGGRGGIAGRSGGSRPWVEAVAPGLMDLRAGRWMGGGGALGGWVAFWALLVWRWDRVVAAPGAGAEERVALGTLLLVGTVSLAWPALRRRLTHHQEAG
jgi:hypothetical protein